MIYSSSDLNSPGECSFKSFDFDAEPVEYCNKGSLNEGDVTYGHFAMASTFVTDFGLICSDQYKASLIFVVN